MSFHPAAIVRTLVPVFLFAIAPFGCARYEFSIVAPPELAQTIPAEQGVALLQEPLEYRLRTVENRLVMHIYNPTADSVQLDGGQSVLVDPQGQSHPLQSQTIASSSYIKLILPPMPARVQRTGPSFGIGFGIGTMGYRNRGYGYRGSLYDPWYDEPHYYAVYDPNDNTYWEWTGDGNVRLTLVYDRGGTAIVHKFEIARRKL